MRELPFDHHLVLAHAEELVEMLELDRAGRFAIAAGGAGPERLGADHAAHERGQLAARVGDDRLALLEQMALEAVVDALQRQRLAGEVGRAGVLAAAAFGAGEGIEPVLPGQVARAAHAGPHVGLVGRLHQLLDVDRRHAVARSTAPEVQGRQRRDDVEVLADRQQHEEGEDDEHLRPVGEHVARLQRRRAHRGERRGERAAAEGEGALVRDRREALGEQRETEAVEREVGHHDRENQRQHEQRFPVVPEARRPQDEAPVERVQHRGHDGQLDRILERREGPAEGVRERRPIRGSRSRSAGACAAAAT